MKRRLELARGLLLGTRAVPSMATNVVVMALSSVAFISPAVWQFGRQDES